MAQWVTTWAQAHADMSLVCKNLKDYTARLTVTSQFSGQKVRLRLSNQEGVTAAVVIGASVQINDDAPVMLGFNGKQELRMAPGESVYTDPMDVNIAIGDLITVSLAFLGNATSGNYLPEFVRCSTKGNYTQTSKMVAKKQSLIMKINGVNSVMPILSSIEIYSEEKQDVLICFGDSITQMALWTKPLSDKLHHTHKNIAVINKGIAGNRLLSDPDNKYMTMFGVAGTKRFTSDVLDVAGGTAVLIALGVNDLNGAKNQNEVTGMADILMQSYLNLASLAKNVGLKVYVATVTPFGGSKGQPVNSENERQKLNSLLRVSTDFDGIIDFDMVLRDLDDPSVMKEYCDSGDHVHPGVIGGKIMAETVYAFFAGK